MKAARAVALGEKVGYQGPELESVMAEGSQLKLNFNHSSKGLMLKGTGNSFAIAGADGQYRWAQVQLKNDQLLLSHPEIKAPVKVRYGWADNPEAVLYNSEGLPAGPFEGTVTK